MKFYVNMSEKGIGGKYNIVGIKLPLSCHAMNEEYFILTPCA